MEKGTAGNPPPTVVAGSHDASCQPSEATWPLMTYLVPPYFFMRSCFVTFMTRTAIFSGPFSW